MVWFFTGFMDILLRIHGNAGSVLYKRYKHISRDKRPGGRAELNNRYEYSHLQRYRIIWQSVEGTSVFNVLYAAVHSYLSCIVQIQLVSRIRKYFSHNVYLWSTVVIAICIAII